MWCSSSWSRVLIASALVLVCLPGVSRAQQPYVNGWVAPLDGVDLDKAAANFGLEAPAYPSAGKWHCGWDIFPAASADVRAIADGEIHLCSPGGWDLTAGTHDNYAIVVRTPTDDGKIAYVGYGHLRRPEGASGKAMSDDEVRRYRPSNGVVRAGDIIGQLGEYGKAKHLHLFVYFDPDRPGYLPNGGYGRQPLPRPPPTDYHGVLSYGCWRSPRDWMRAFSSSSGGKKNEGGHGNTQVAVDMVTSLVVDVSGSMAESCPNYSGTKLSAVQEAVQRILRIVGNASKAFQSGVAPFGLVSFSDAAEEVQAVTPDLDAVANGVASLQPTSSTNMADGISKGVEQVTPQQGDRCIILLSDGLTNTGLGRDVLMDSSSTDSPVKQAADSAIKIYTVGFGQQIDEELLRQIAQATGGEYYYADDGYSLSRMYVRVCLSSRGEILLQREGTSYQGQSQLLDKIQIAYGTGGLSAVITCLGSEVAPRLKDPSGKLVDENYPGATVVRGNPSCVFISKPSAGAWEFSAVGLDCHGAEPFEAVASAEKPKAYAYGGGGGAVSGDPEQTYLAITLGGCILLLVMIAATTAARGRVPPRRIYPPIPIWMVTLREPERASRMVPTRARVIYLGRAADNTIVVDDPRVSGHHLQIRIVPQGYWVQDLGSRGGTWIGDRRVVEPVLLAAGSQIRAGSTIISLHRR